MTSHVRAPPRLPARAAGQEVRPAAAVEQDDRLARRRRAPRACRGCSARRASRMSTISTGGSARAVDARAAGAGARSAWTLSGRGVALPATSTAPACARAPLGDAPRVVARVALVLVGRVVLLVDDDQAEPLDRREDRRARPDADARLARAQPRPLVVALARARAWSAGRRRCRRSASTKRDTICGVSAISGTSTITPRPCASAARGRPQVDLGLARAGDAVQQQPLAGRRRSTIAAQRRRLVGGQLAAARAAAPTATCSGRAAHDARRDAHEPARLEPAQRGEVAAGEARQRGEQRALAVGQALAAGVGRRRSRRGPQRGLRPACPSAAAASDSARAGVEQYSAAIHSARSTSSAGSARLEHAPRRDAGRARSRRPAR